MKRYNRMGLMGNLIYIVNLFFNVAVFFEELYGFSV
jgi:hypothetical protein